MVELLPRGIVVAALLPVLILSLVCSWRGGGPRFGVWQMCHVVAVLLAASLLTGAAAFKPWQISHGFVAVGGFPLTGMPYSTGLLLHNYCDAMVATPDLACTPSWLTSLKDCLQSRF